MSHVTYRRTSWQDGQTDVMLDDLVIGHIDIDPRTAHFVFLPGEDNRIVYELSDRTLGVLKQKIETEFVPLH